jgi:hypothetical protein
LRKRDEEAGKKGEACRIIPSSEEDPIWGVVIKYRRNAERVIVVIVDVKKLRVEERMCLFSCETRDEPDVKAT